MQFTSVKEYECISCLGNNNCTDTDICDSCQYECNGQELTTEDIAQRKPFVSLLDNVDDMTRQYERYQRTSSSFCFMCLSEIFNEEMKTLHRGMKVR